MQNTLLALAIAIILALVTALAGPFLVDWTTYRALFEKEASRLTGLEVRVYGTIDARLLPSPRLQLQGIEIGRGDQRMRARGLAVEFALGPLLRGEWRAADMQLVGPELALSIDAAGKVEAPSLAFNFDPDALTIERLNITDGKATLHDAASGTTIEINKLWFNGELRSLLGPVKGEGAATIGTELYPFRISSGRASDAGALRIHLNVDPAAAPMSLEADGVLAFAQSKPQFDGTFSLARPVGIAPRGSSALLTQPWRLNGKLKATPASALMEQVEFAYGSDAQAVRLSGTAELLFGATPRFDGVLSAQKIDLDRLSGETDAAPPAATLRRLASLAGQAFRPPFPMQIGLGIEQVTLGGADILGLRGDISTAGGGWTLERFEFRAPGSSQIRLGGRLVFTPSGAEFTGPAEIAAGDPGFFAAWLEGRNNAAHAAAPQPLQMRGALTLGNERVAIDKLDANFGRGALTGRLAYVFGAGGGRLEAALNAHLLDIDAMLALGQALSAGSSFERPREISLALDVARARFAGIEAGKTDARLQYDGDRLKIEQLSVANLGGANIAAKGEIAFAPLPRGELSLDIDARELSGFAALMLRYAPDIASRLTMVAPVLAPAKLHAGLKLEGGNAASRTTLVLTGTAGGARIAFNGEGDVDLAALNLASLRLQGQVDAADSSVFIPLLGLDRVVAVTQEPGKLRLTLSGSPFGDMSLITWLSSPAVSASLTGQVRLAPEGGASGSGYLNIERADLAPLALPLAAPGNRQGLPFALTTRVSFDRQQVTADEISAVVAGNRLRGKLTARREPPYDIRGALAADALEAGALIAAVSGMPGAGAASTNTFGAGPFGDLSGEVLVKAARLGFAPNIDAREASASLRFGRGDIALNDIAATLGGGRFTGKIELSRGPEGLAAKANFSLSDADLIAFQPDAARPPITGRLGLQTEVEGVGRSPLALIGSLQGTGKVTLFEGQFAGLDPRAFAVVVRAVDAGQPVEVRRISDLAGSALMSGALPVKRAEGELAIAAGQVRLSNARASGEGADLSLSGMLDLASGSLDARLVLSGAELAAGAHPDIYLALRGPWTSPARSVDVSAFTGWLAMRAVERQAKRLDALEAAPKAGQKKSEQAPPLPPPLTIAPTGNRGGAGSGRIPGSVGPQN